MTSLRSLFHRFCLAVLGSPDPFGPLCEPDVSAWDRLDGRK